MSLVVQHTHYMPKKWRGKENSDVVRMEFETLFQYTGMMLLEEMASIFLTPYLLIFVVPQRVDDILQFIADFTVDVEGVGHVCSFSVFDFQNHGNIMYGSPHNSHRIQRSSQGKMEKSFLSFQSNYPSWEPNSQGKQFLSTLKIFREQKLQGQERIPAYLSPRMQQWNPNLRGQGDLNNFFSREALHNIPERAYQIGSLWLIDSNQKNYLNVLDWYYTSGPHLATETRRDVPSGSFNVAASTRNWIPPNMAHNEATYDKNWGQLFDDRSESHLEASTAAPLFQRSVLHHDDSVDASHHPSRSHWWARSTGPGGNTQTSFLEPPTFNRDTDHYYDNLSDRSITEEQDHLYWRRSNRLSQTFYMDDLEGGQFNLPFDDIYSRHSTSPVPDPSNLV